MKEKYVDFHFLYDKVDVLVKYEGEISTDEIRKRMREYMQNGYKKDMFFSDVIKDIMSVFDVEWEIIYMPVVVVC
jgi:hypothetical protein